MRSALFVVALSSVFCGIVQAGGPPGIFCPCSLFDDDSTEGWKVVDLTYRGVGAPPPILATYDPPSYSATGGVGDSGHIWFDDVTDKVFYWSAPGGINGFLGDQSASYGASLTYHLKAENGSYLFSQEDVVLVGAGKTLVFDTTVIPDGTWHQYTVGLTENGWRVGSLSGPAASQSDMQSVLGDLTALYIRGEFRGTLDDIGRLDEVKLLQPIGVEASNFTLNSEGWTAVDLTYRAVGSPPTELGTLTHMHSGSGGTSGGHIWIDDPTVNVFYWSAPGDYLGNRSDSYGASLSFHLKAEGGSYIFSQEDVVLFGGGKTLVFDTTVVPDGAWQNYTVGLTETGWRVGSLSGPAASEADMKAVLANLQKLYIRGEFRGTVDDIGRLDTVELFEIADCAPLETEGIPDLLGDYNDDGQVDAADYVVWRKNPGAFGGDPGGYNTWRANFGAAVGGGSSSGAATAVPEPSAFVSLLIGLAALARPARTAIRPGPRRRRT